ncbi:MAG: hypothetical protein CMM96_00700 [Rickettsiales bacterium]|nr:hypothetical protein [Rickettsiales bacterium]
MFKYFNILNLISLYFGKASQPLFIFACVIIFQSEFNELAKNIIGATFFSGILLSLSQPILIKLFESDFKTYKNIIFNINISLLILISIFFLISNQVETSLLILTTFLLLKGTNDYWVAKENFIVQRALYGIPIEVIRYYLLFSYIDINQITVLLCLPMMNDLILHFIKNTEKILVIKNFEKIDLSKSSLKNIIFNQIKNLEGLSIYLLSIKFIDSASIILLGQQVVGIVIVFFQVYWFKILSKINSLRVALKEYVNSTKLIRYGFLFLIILFLIIAYTFEFQQLVLVLLVSLTLISIRSYIIDPMVFLATESFRKTAVVGYFTMFLSTFLFINILNLEFFLIFISLTIILNLIFLFSGD